MEKNCESINNSNVNLPGAKNKIIFQICKGLRNLSSVPETLLSDRIQKNVGIEGEGSSCRSQD